MAERNFMFFNTTGNFIDTAADGDSTTLGGLTMGGNINMNSAGKITNSNDASGAGDCLVYGQSGAALAGLTMSGDIAMGDQKITGLGAPTADGDAARKSYVDQQVITGGKIKEALLHENQLDDAEGILACVALTLQNQAANDDRVVITDGTTTRTYYFGTGTGDVQVTIGASIAESMQNLASAIQGDASAAWGAYFTTDLDAIDSDGVVVIIEDDNDGTASEIYGTNWDAGDCQIVDFSAEVDYTKKTLEDLPTSDPASTNFGMRRTQSALVDGELHYTLNDDVIYGWDDAGNTWNTLSGSASIPDATGASGGGTKGKATFDTDYGLSVSSGIVTLNITADKGLHFVSGALEIEIASANELSADANGLAVEGVPTQFKIGATPVGATVTAANLDDLTDGSTADSLHTHTGTSVSLNHSDLGGIGTDDHHAQSHTIASHSDTTATGAELDTLTDGSNADALHSHSGTDEAQRIENALVALEALTLGDPVYGSTTSGKVGKARADTDAKARVLGLAKTTVSADESIEVVSEGVWDGGVSGATPGDEYWLDATGGLVVDPPSGNNRVVFIGVAVTATKLFLQIQDHGKKPA